ncbi:unnamed protein product [Microthlaspi erraticum]|uniref:Uncharacterized protein n=1 Tax=Microthlaspi erraticum TaxID=1685480 RepID=A0A6D2HWD1_9BRAS|nr:unnamed protein product [Microthlaspi erraticum]
MTSHLHDISRVSLSGSKTSVHTAQLASAHMWQSEISTLAKTQSPISTPDGFQIYHLDSAVRAVAQIQNPEAALDPIRIRQKRVSVDRVKRWRRPDLRRLITDLRLL